VARGCCAATLGRHVLCLISHKTFGAGLAADIIVIHAAATPDTFGRHLTADSSDCAYPEGIASGRLRDLPHLRSHNERKLMSRCTLSEKQALLDAKSVLGAQALTNWNSSTCPCGGDWKDRIWTVVSCEADHVTSM
jgi:hypothetical protein